MRHTLLRFLQSATLPQAGCRAAGVRASVCPIVLCVAALCTALAGEGQVWPQSLLAKVPENSTTVRLDGRSSAHRLRAERFLAGRGTAGELRSAKLLDRARRQHAVMLAKPRDASLSVAWHPVGPMQIESIGYGNVTGRITAVAIDPADSTGNTVYIGTTGGGVWKSANAAGAASSVTFTPLTDTLPVFSPDAGSATIASLSIGALSVANGVVLAGTGDPNDALDSYYGTGLLRSADGGATWTLAQESHDGVNGNHTFFGLGFAGLAWSSVAPSTVVAAVSDAVEGVIVNAPDVNYSVRGLYYSTDAGVTWQMAIIQDGSQIVQSPQPGGLNAGGNAATSVVWNPVRQRFYAAVRYHGYYESPDGSVWTRLTAQPGTGLTATACPADPGSTGSGSCPIFRGTLAVEPVSGDTFAFTVDVQNLDQGIWRDQCNLTGSVCSNSSVAFGTRLDTAPLEQPDTTIAQGDYDLSLAAVASGTDTLVFAGAVDLYRCSLAAGCSFRNTTNTENGCAAPAMVAPAQHAIATLATGSAPLLYLGNDGGVWRSTDGVGQQGSLCSTDDATHFQNLNGGLGSLAEVVNFSQHPSDADTLLVGAGANGTAATAAASSFAAWPQLAVGEGGFTAIDPATPANWYISTAPGVGISYCGKGAACAASDFAGPPTIGPVQVGGDAALIDAPWILDPGYSSDVVVGTCRVWRGPAADGSDWASTNALSTSFAGTEEASCGDTDSYVRSLAAGGGVSNATIAANAGSEILYAGLAGIFDGGGSVGGHLFSTSTGNTAGPTTVWTDLALAPVTNDTSDGGAFNPGGFDISSVAVDPHDTTGGTVYATVAGFAGNGVNAPHIYRSIDMGAHWTNITSNLPNAPANSVAVDPNDANTLYVALDTGVYATSQVTSCTAANCWSVYGANLPNTPVVQLGAASAIPVGGGSAGVLRAATYGRGIWEIPLLTAAPPVSAQIAMTPESLSFPSQAVGSASAAKSITIANSGTAPLIVDSVATSGSFQETDDCIGTPVVAGASCTAQVVFFAATVGTNSGALTVSANIAGGQATAALSGIGAAPAAILLSPLSLDFGVLTVGQTTAAQDITVSNTGGVTATLQTPAVTGDFEITANTCQTSLAPGVSCTVAIVFSPTAAGTRNGVFTIADSAGTQNTSLTGSGASVATDMLAPTSLSFAPQMAGTASSTQTVTLTNSGDAALTLIAAQITSGDFTVVSGCGSSLSGHAACTFQVAFAPTTAGQLTGTLTVFDALRTQTVALSGTGLAPPKIQLSPASLSFAGTAVGQSSSSQTITITNSGDGQLTVASVVASGDFSETDNCIGVALYGSGRACNVKVTFSPTAAGARSGVLMVNGSAAGQQTTATLSGVGLAPAAIVLDPTSLNFGTVTLGTTSLVQNITVSNTGGVASPLQTPSVSGDFKISANTCGATLAASTGCTVAIIFTPTVSGLQNGTFSIAGAVGIQSAALSGVGASVATDGLAPLALSFPVLQEVGTASATQPVTLTNTGDNPLTLIAVSMSNGNFTATSGCGPSLAGHATCTFAVASTPLINGVTSGVMTISDQFRSQTVSLSGVGVAPPGVQLSPATLSFPGTALKQPSSGQTVQISNFGIGQLTVTSVAISGDFTESDSCAGKVLSGTATCAVQVTFTPSAAGTRTGILTVLGSAPGSATALQKTAALTGIGEAPAAIVLDPTSASFGTVTLGSSSIPATNITISNLGGVPATLQTPTITGDFAITANTCGTTLAGSTGCTVAIVFTPTATGLRNGILSIADSAGTQTAALTGTGASNATDALTPLAFSFVPQQVGTASATQSVTLSNSGDNPLTLIAVQFSGGNFTVTSGCGVSLNGHSSCAIAVASTPAAVGVTSGSLTVSDQFRSQTVALSGAGLAPQGVSLSPAAGLIFAATGVAQASTAQTVTLSNESASSLALDSVAATGDFSIPTAANTCGSSVAANAACTFQVVFTPSVAGSRTGLLTVSDGAAGAPQTLSLQGIGIDFTLNANGASSVTISNGASAVYPLLLSSAAGTPGSATMSCTGAPANATCVIVPASVPLGATTTLTATVETGVTAAASAKPLAERPHNGIWWAMTLPLGLFFAGFAKKRRGGWLQFSRALSLMMLVGLLCAIGCGSGRIIPGTTQTGTGSTTVSTPSGTYSIIVSATSAGLTRSVTLTLVVQ